MGNKERIEELERLISESKYNKATQHAIGRYKAQLAKLRAEEEKKQKSTGSTSGYHVKKTGDATVVLLGFPSAGKSTLLNALTGADSEIGAYSFTTLNVIPGILKHKGANIQILDVPGIVRGAAYGRGRGQEVLSVLRSADLVLMLLDPKKKGQKEKLEEEVHNAGIRLGEKKPDVKITKKGKDGVRVSSTVPLPNLSEEEVVAVLKEFGIVNADVVIRTQIDVDQFVDCVEGNRKYVPYLTVVNKKDMLTKDELEKVMERVDGDLAISAEKGSLEELKDKIFEGLSLIRIYMKEPREDPDMDEPLIVTKGTTVKGVCKNLHRDMMKKFRHAKIWGESAKFPGQRQGKDHVVKDGDVVEIHVR